MIFDSPDQRLTITGLCITHLYWPLQLDSMAVISTHWTKLRGFASMLGSAIEELHSVCGYSLDGGFGTCPCFHCRQASTMPHVSQRLTWVRNVLCSVLASQQAFWQCTVSPALRV